MWLQCQGKENTLPYKYSVNPSTAQSHQCWLLSRTHTLLSTTVPVIAAKTAKASHLPFLFAFLVCSCAAAELFADLQSKPTQVSAFIRRFYYDGLCHKCDFVLGTHVSHTKLICCAFKGSYAITNVAQMSNVKRDRSDPSKKISSIH